MIKIEQLKLGTEATVEKAGKAMQVYPGMVVTPQELKTLKVTAGYVVYTIDEQEIVRVEAEPKPEPVVVKQETPVVSDVKKVVASTKLKSKNGWQPTKRR